MLMVGFTDKIMSGEIKGEDMETSKDMLEEVSTSFYWPHHPQFPQQTPSVNEFKPPRFYEI